MKKVVKFIVLLVFLLLVSKIIIRLFTKEHNTSYSLTSSDNKYIINEKFKKFDSLHNYDFTVKQNNKVYSFSYQQDFNKQKKIIKDIKYYKSGKLECIYPIYKKKSVSNLYCLLDNKQVSYSYLIGNKNANIEKILKKAKKDGYKNDDYEISDKLIKKGFISVYSENIPSQYIYTIWFYKGIYVIKDGNIIEKNLLEKDRYENKLSSLVGKYYITFNTDSFSKSAEYDELISYNIDNEKVSIIKLEDKLSSNTYINGNYSKKLYITDNDSKKQFIFDPYKESIKEIGNVDIGFKNYQNGKMTTTRSNTENIFSNLVSNKEISKLYKDVEIRRYLDNYYFKTKNGDVYEIINNQYKNPVLLFNEPSIEELKIKDGIISFVADDTIYIYKDGYGLKPVIVDTELNYNCENIYDFMEK